MFVLEKIETSEKRRWACVLISSCNREGACFTTVRTTHHTKYETIRTCIFTNRIKNLNVTVSHIKLPTCTITKPYTKNIRRNYKVIVTSELNGFAKRNRMIVFTTGIKSFSNFVSRFSTTRKRITPTGRGLASHFISDSTSAIRTVIFRLSVPEMFAICYNLSPVVKNNFVTFTIMKNRMCADNSSRDAIGTEDYITIHKFTHRRPDTVCTKDRGR